MSGDYGGGFGPNRGNFSNQGMPMNNMGMQNQNQMMNFQQQQQMMMMNQQQQQQQMVPGNVPDPGMMGNPMPVANPVGMHSPQQQQQQQQQMRQQSIMSNLLIGQQQQVPQQQPQMVQNPNTMSLQTPTGPNPPMMEPQQQPQPAPMGNPQAQQQLGQPMNQNQFNPVTLCKFAQETMQEIVCRFQEIFSSLRTSAPPNGMSQVTEKKVQEQLRTIRLLFKRIRILYDRLNDGAQISMEYTQVESLIPMKDELDNRPEPPHNEEYKKAMQENRELTENLSLRNKQLREVIDRMRIMIWEMNTMLSMRRS